MNNIDKLPERQKEVNAKCGFELNYDGLILGYHAEVGELCSVIALYESFKKPKPKDLEKFGGWDFAKKTGAVVYESDSDNGYKNYDISCNITKTGYYLLDSEPFLEGLSFEEAWNHEITRDGLKQEIADELADVLVHILQLRLLVRPIENTSLPKLDEVANLALDLVDFNTVIDLIAPSSLLRLNKLAKTYEIDLEKAYFDKTEKLIQRFK